MYLLVFNKLFGEDVISNLLTSLSSDHFYRRYKIYFLRKDISTYSLRKTPPILQGKLIPSAISYMKVKLGLISSPFEQGWSWGILNSSVCHWTYSSVVHNHRWERMSLLRVNSLGRRLEMSVLLSAGASGASTEWGPRNWSLNWLSTQNPPGSLTTGDNRHVWTAQFCNIHKSKQTEPPLKKSNNRVV